MQPGAAALDEAQTALKEGNWEAARSAFQAALDEEVTAEALQGLSQAEWWLSNEDEAVSLREQAHAAFRKGHDLVGAVRTALWLANEYRTVYGNESAANGWLTKAQRLAEKAPPGPISGWMAEARARGAADPAIKERYAAEVTKSPIPNRSTALYAQRDALRAEARTMAEEFVLDNEAVLEARFGHLSREEMVEEIDHYRALGREEALWTAKAWALANFDPQHIGGKGHMKVERRKIARK